MDELAYELMGVWAITGSGGNRSDLDVASDGPATLQAAARPHPGSADLSGKERPEMALAWTAHELCAPIVAARAAVASALQEGCAGDSARDLLGRAERELGRAVELVESLLRWAASTAPLKLAPIDLTRVVAEAVRSSATEERTVTVSLHAPAPVTVTGDGTHLRSAVSNLIRNAVSYSPQGSEISVAVNEEGGRATVTVEDEGPGVQEADRDTLFDPFSRGGTGATTRAGQGLGLYIARRITEAHDGLLWMEPKEHGVAFKMQLSAEGGRC
ncbi:MAG: sensor histidine kinase [Actinomycetota bacterium]